MNKFKEFYETNLNEILEDKGLILTGFLLSLTHLIHFIYFYPAWAMAELMQRGSDGVCIPGLSNCLEWRFLSQEQVIGLIYAYGLLALVSAIFFCFKDKRKLAILFLLVLQVTKNFIIFHDARLYSAHNYITNFIFALFLFAPDKRQSIKVLLVLVYFWSGLMHLNSQWIDGTLLRENWKFFPSYLEYLTIYVVILEIFIAWALLSRNNKIFLLAFVQFVLFHLISFSVIQWLYPAIMLVLLPTFLIFAKWEMPRPKLRIFSLNYGIILLFSLLQLIPRLLPDRLLLQGDGRFFYSMHQFYAGVDCISEGSITYKTGAKSKINLLDELLYLHARLRCEPTVTVGSAKAACKRLQSDKNFDKLAVVLKSRFTGSDASYETILDQESFCTAHSSE